METRADLSLLAAGSLALTSWTTTLGFILDCLVALAAIAASTAAYVYYRKADKRKDIE